MIEPIHTDAAPTPGGHYSQAVRHNGTVYVAGLLPVRANGERELGDIDQQFAVIVESLRAILGAAGSDLSHVLRATIYVTSIESWPTVNRAFAEAFGEHRPARTVVPVSELHYGFAVEMDVIAACRP